MTTNRTKQIEERLILGPATVATIARELGCGVNSLTAAIKKLSARTQISARESVKDPVTGRLATVWELNEEFREETRPFYGRVGNGPLYSFPKGISGVRIEVARKHA